MLTMKWRLHYYIAFKIIIRYFMHNLFFLFKNDEELLSFNRKSKILNFQNNNNPDKTTRNKSNSSLIKFE